MAEDVTVSEETLTGALSLLVSLGQILLQNAQQEAAASLQTFVPHKITTLFGLITAGENFYRRIGVKTKGEAEAVWQKLYHHPAVREQVEELLNLENEWDSFLQSVDKDLQTTDELLSRAKPADSLSPDSVFTDARSKEQECDSGSVLGSEAAAGSNWTFWMAAVTGPCGRAGDQSGQSTFCDLFQKPLKWAKMLKNHLQTLLEAQSVRVMVVSFGSVEGAQLWLEQTGCTFEMLLDSQKKVYQSFGLGSSFSKVLKFGCLMQLSEFSAADRDVPDFPHRLLEDIYQLGGDFLLDETGKVLLSHPSKTPLDRPSLKDVLQAAEDDSTSSYEDKNEQKP
ncbi:hypothetical protein CCH79_00000590 [Gambusia affinis]|uniref:Selenoprotein L n=1 Tax=Gambusia affinis TaxID=33528 RepID=A0A315VUU0_GAMAF|nr:hypothetical protein CCH79_00000590 [Gambusia affinis]